MKSIKDITFEINTFNFEDLNKVLPEDINREKAIEEINHIKSSILENITPREDKLIIHMAGIPGSGKTTYCQSELLGKFEKNKILYLGFDSFMEEISFYQIEKERDAAKAFDRWEIPARIAGYELLSDAFNKELSVLFDHSAANPQHIDLLKLFKNAGYRLEMYYLGGTTDQLYPRVKAREKITKRHFPFEKMQTRYDLLERNLKHYRTLVDQFYNVTNI